MASFEARRTRAYDEDLRWRMVYQRCVLELPYSEVGSSLGVDPSTVQRTVEKFLQTGLVSKQAYPSGHDHPKQKVTRTDEFVILQLVLERPNVYLHEIQQELSETTGTAISTSTICNFLHKNGFTRRKLTRVALQRSEELRLEFKNDMSIIKTNMLVFLDETGLDRRDAARKFGYGLRGKPVKSVKLLTRGKHLSAIAAMSTEGLLDYKIVDEAVDAEKYQEFIDECLLPKLYPFNGINPQSVMVLDNAAIHHVHHAVGSFEGLGVLVHFLPPYSPDMNPIEEMFAKVKSVMKANETLLDNGTDLTTIIMMGLASITPSDCRGWIANAGYM